MAEMNAVSYLIRRATVAPALTGDWDSAGWEAAETLAIDQFRPESSDHRPATRARVLYDDAGLHVIFRVEDRYVLTTCTEYHGDVCRDACVEFFVKPKPDKAYLNFEVNSGGTLLLSYNDGGGRMPDGSVDATKVPWELASSVKICPSMPTTTSPEVEDPVTWTVQYAVPFELLEHYVGPLGDVAGQEWRANFYKCSEQNSHPHWASWSPVTGPLDFHQPACFAPIRFEP